MLTPLRPSSQKAGREGRPFYYTCVLLMLYADHKAATAPTGLEFTMQAQEQAMLEEGDALPGSLCLCVPLQNLNLDLTRQNCVIFCCHPQVVSDGTDEPQMPSELHSS